jgi:hippurate hydrolase
MLTEHLLDAARDLSDEIVALRRAIHAEPELGLHTPLTMAKVRDALSDLPLEWRVGTSTTGSVAVLKGAREGQKVLLRGDMDALPMDENTGLDFASTIAGRMHACGHDTHTAMLAGAARLLCSKQDEIPGEVHFMFQPGEEGHHGARFMIEDGLIDDDLGAAFALHIMPNAQFGVLGSRSGPLLAAADQFEITVQGAGGHASMPHDTQDPIPVAAEIVLAIQGMVTRRFNAQEATIVTVAKLESGSTFNVIPDNALLMGTIRTLSPERRAAAREATAKLAQGIAEAHGMTANIRLIEGFPPTINDARAVALGAEVARSVSGKDGFLELADPIMGAEDFSYVLQRTPGAMFFLGVAGEGTDWRNCCAIHSSRMMVDESAMPIGTAWLSGCALQYLEQGWS